MPARRLACAGLCLLVALGGCANIAQVHPHSRQADRSADDPIFIVTATFVPQVEVDIALRSKAEGAAQGVALTALQCSPALAGGPVFAVGVFLPCLVLGGIVVGLVNAADVADGLQDPAWRRFGNAVDTQQALAHQAWTYLAAHDRSVAALPSIAGPNAADASPAYGPAALPGRGSLLELSMQSIRYVGSGRVGAPICLHMAARGRRLDARTGAEIDAIEYAETADCQSPQQWLALDDAALGARLRDGYRRLAENIVDELFLVYHPPGGDQRPGQPAHSVPRYVLAPLQPPAPETYLDFRSLSGLPENAVGFGGMHFVDVDSLTPTLRWEAFPRPFDASAQADTPTAVRYDVRVYAGHRYGQFVAPARLLLEQRGLTDKQHRITSALDPCRWYFWTVRASFQLGGVRRVTDWSGAYHTAGGTFAPSRSRRHSGPSLTTPWPASYLYLPFRTPERDGSMTCWR